MSASHVTAPEPSLRRIAVFCGARTGNDPRHAADAVRLGSFLAERGIGLVYGGGSIGLMGVLAEAVLDGGGEVIGVITESLLKSEVGHTGVTELKVVATMHERKACMAELADAFVMLPGGFGTLDEFFEVVTWRQLGIHDKPCGILDPQGYYQKLTAFLDEAVSSDFVTTANRDLVVLAATPESLLTRFGLSHGL